MTVHGTWAKDARWAKPDSMLGRAVLESARERAELATIVPFHWSGKNSIAARRKAGAVLGRRLMELRHQDPLQPIYVIAHSHGGSVFAYALKEQPGLADHVDGFIALATPWIAVQPCGYAVALRSLLLKAIFYLSFLPSLLGAGRALAWYLDYLDGLRPVAKDESFETFGLDLADVFIDIANFGALYVLIGLALGVVWYLLNRRLAGWLAASVEDFERQISVAADEAGTLVHGRLPPSAFFKPIGDEAALALVWTSGMASLMQAASQLLFRVLQLVRDSWLSIPRYCRVICTVALILVWSIGTAILAFFTLMANGATTAAKLANAIGEMLPLGFRFDDLDFADLVWDSLPVIALILWGGLILLLVALIGAALVAWLAAAGAGIPTLRTALFMRIVVEATPLGNQQLVLVDVTATPRQGRVAAETLSHSSLYESANVIAAVLSAVRGFPERGVRQTNVVPG